MSAACRKLIDTAPAIRRWAKLRRNVKHVRPIAIYWLEKTQVAICAPGGAGRAHDLQAFEEDTAGHHKRPMDQRHEARKRMKKTFAAWAADAEEDVPMGTLFAQYGLA
jgi:hypothetical protein